MNYLGLISESAFSSRKWPQNTRYKKLLQILTIKRRLRRPMLN